MSEMCPSGMAEKTHVTAVVCSNLQNVMFLAGENLITDNEKMGFPKTVLCIAQESDNSPCAVEISLNVTPGSPIPLSTYSSQQWSKKKTPSFYELV